MFRKRVVHKPDLQELVDITKTYPTMHNLKSNFDKIHEITKETLSDSLNTVGDLILYPRRSKMADSEIISLSICCEALGIDSENYFWSKLKHDYASDFPNLIHRTNFNRRRKRLAHYIQQVTEKISSVLNEGENTFILDSMPVPVCKIVRERWCKICKESFETAPDKGYTASLEKWFYGYKLQLITSIKGVYKCMELTKASIHDVEYLRELKHDPCLTQSLIIADRGYLSVPKQTELFECNEIRLYTPMRRGQRNYRTFPWVFKKQRKRIETLFSQLSDQMMIKRNYAKSFNGLTTRIISKIASVTVLQLINHRNNKPINHLKHALAA